MAAESKATGRPAGADEVDVAPPDAGPAPETPAGASEGAATAAGSELAAAATSAGAKGPAAAAGAASADAVAIELSEQHDSVTSPLADRRGFSHRGGSTAALSSVPMSATHESMQLDSRATLSPVTHSRPGNLTAPASRGKVDLQQRRAAVRRARLRHACPTVAACLYGAPGRHGRGGLFYRLRQPSTYVLLAVLAAGVAASLVLSSLNVRNVRSELLSAAADRAAEMYAQLSVEKEAWADTVQLAAAGAYAAMYHGVERGVDPRALEVVGQSFRRSRGEEEGMAFLLRVPGSVRSEFEANATRLWEPLGVLPPSAFPLYIKHPSGSRVADKGVHYVLWSTHDAADWPLLAMVDLLDAAGPGAALREVAINASLASGNVTATAPLDVIGDFGGWSYVLFAPVGPMGSGLLGEQRIGLVATGVESTKLTADALGIERGREGVHFLEAESSQSAKIVAQSLKNDHLEILDVTGIGSDADVAGVLLVNAAGSALLFDETDKILVLDQPLVFASREWRVRVRTSRLAVAAAEDAEREAAEAEARTTRIAGILSTVAVVAVGALVIVWYDSRQIAERTRLRAQVAAQTHDQLVSYICHELRNPLHHLNGGLKLLMEDHALVITHRMREELKQLLQSAAQMTHIVNDILDMRKLDAGEITLQPSPIDLRALLRDLSHQLRECVRPSTTLRVVVDDSLPSTIITDPVRVRQLLGNAMYNAAQHTERGCLDVVVRTFRNKRWLLLEVRNTGEGLGGIPGDKLLGVIPGSSDDEGTVGGDSASGSSADGPSVRLPRPRAGPSPSLLAEVQQWFAESVSTVPGDEVSLPPKVAAGFSDFTVTRFTAASDNVLSPTSAQVERTQGDADDVPYTSVMRNASGLGIGLPLCRRLAFHMGGAIGLHDTTGFTRWWTLLPLGRLKPRRSARRNSTEQSLQSFLGLAERSSLSVLAADDEKVLRRMLSRYLDDFGVSASIFNDGLPLRDALLEAVERDEAPLCVLMDIVMMRSDGADVCRQLRAAGIEVPIYAMTGNADDISAAKYRAWGFNGILAKPFDQDHVAVVLAHAYAGARTWISIEDVNRAAEKVLAQRTGEATIPEDVSWYASSPRRSMATPRHGEHSPR